MQASNYNPAALQKQVQELLQAKEAKEAELIECKQQLQACNSDLTTLQGMVMAAETQLAAATAALSSSRQQLAEQADQLQANQAHLEELKQQLNNSQTAAEVMMHCSAMSAVAEPTHFVAACACCATAWFYRSCCRSGKQPWLRCCQLFTGACSLYNRRRCLCVDAVRALCHAGKGSSHQRASGCDQ